MTEMNQTPQFYDVVDSEGTVVETAAEQQQQQPNPKPIDIRKARRQYVTVRLPRVIPCGHKLDLSRKPIHINCPSCVFAWFQNHGEICQQLDEMYNLHGPESIIQLKGIKFYKQWRKFMATVAQWKEAEEEK